MDKIRVLVTGAGGSAAYNFCQSLLDTHKWQFELYGTDINIYHLMANDLLAESYLVPKLDNPTYLDEMIDCIGDWDINLVHPQPDPEVLFIADHRNMLPTSTLLPTTETIALCQDKMLLHDRLEEAGVRVP